MNSHWSVSDECLTAVVFNVSPWGKYNLDIFSGSTHLIQRMFPCQASAELNGKSMSQFNHLNPLCWRKKLALENWNGHHWLSAFGNAFASLHVNLLLCIIMFICFWHYQISSSAILMNQVTNPCDGKDETRNKISL